MATRALASAFQGQGKWLLPALVIFLFTLTYIGFQFDYNNWVEEDFHLPRPIADWNAVNIRNTYTLAEKPKPAVNINGKSNGHAMSMTFIVRTYNKFLAAKSTEKLLQDLEKQTFSSDETRFPVTAVVVATDADSTAPVRNAVRDSWKGNELYKHVDVHFHELPFQVYVDNCCQIDEMCIGQHKHNFIKEANKDSVFGRYRDVNKKIRTVCGGNNMLHYAITDAALKYVIDSCTGTNECENKLVVATNGDNSYDARFAERVMLEFQKDEKVDAVMVDYMERGEQLVQVGLEGNSMDLGAMVFRVSSLKRFAEEAGKSSKDHKGVIGFLTPLSQLKNAWPHDYYAADNHFMKYLIRRHGAKVALVAESLFTHW